MSKTKNNNFNVNIQKYYNNNINKKFYNIDNNKNKNNNNFIIKNNNNNKLNLNIPFFFQKINSNISKFILKRNKNYDKKNKYIFDYYNITKKSKENLLESKNLSLLVTNYKNFNSKFKTNRNSEDKKSFFY